MYQDFKIVFDMLISVIAGFFSFLAFLLNFVMISGISPSPLELLKCLLIAALLCASAFISAAEAEKKEHKRFIHFIIGLLIPYLYPLIIHFTLPRNTVTREIGEPSPEERMRNISQKDLTMKLKDKQKDTLAKFVHKEAVVEPQPEAENNTENQQKTIFIPQSEIAEETEKKQHAIASEHQPQPEPKTDLKLQRYYASIATDDSGNSNGPFMLELTDKRIVEAIKITESLPELIEIEISAGQENAPPRRIRIPYTKISKCTLKSQWING